MGYSNSPTIKPPHAGPSGQKKRQPREGAASKSSSHPSPYMGTPNNTTNSGAPDVFIEYGAA